MVERWIHLCHRKRGASVVKEVPNNGVEVVALKTLLVSWLVLWSYLTYCDRGEGLRRVLPGKGLRQPDVPSQSGSSYFPSDPNTVFVSRPSSCVASRVRRR